MKRGESGPKPIIGIDLGTTHCAIAVASGDEDEGVSGKVEVFALPQLVAKSAIEARPLLPSFLYFAHESEGAQALPWDQDRSFAVGEYARSRGADAPARMIASAKSWLSHAGIDRRAGTLPIVAADDVAKISPVEASTRYLAHIVEAYDAHATPSGLPSRFADAEVVLTVPASFDAAARDLTVEAATKAGITNVTLLEEPQAALYAWIDAVGDGWRKHIRVGDVILVLDVGGGTTDFSAIAALEKNGALELTRIAVGDHILLGGDNMDLALAHVVRTKLLAEKRELDRFQVAALTHACRSAKELLLGDASIETAPIVIAARGSKLLGGTLRTELTRDEVTATLVDGFFPQVSSSEKPAVRPRVGLTQIGLPYASDPAITKHLAAFLSRQADATSRLEGFSSPGASVDPGRTMGTILHPTVVLFNGGVMKSNAIRDRVVKTLDGWLLTEGAPAVRVLGDHDFDLAVARGAASYGRARRGRGIRIRGGTARAYYVGIESAMPAVPGVPPPVTALCLAPFGMEEGSEASLPKTELGVVVGETVHFRFFGSSVRRDDVAGTTLDGWKEGELEELSPIEIALAAEGRTGGDVVPVHLRASVTEVGTLLLEAIPTHPRFDGERWRIELSVRAP